MKVFNVIRRQDWEFACDTFSSREQANEYAKRIWIDFIETEGVAQVMRESNVRNLYALSLNDLVELLDQYGLTDGMELEVISCEVDEAEVSDAA
jgi:hypothetical protein